MNQAARISEEALRELGRVIEVHVALHSLDLRSEAVPAVSTWRIFQ